MKSRLVAVPDIDGVKDDILMLKRDLASLIDKMIAADVSGNAARDSAEHPGDGAHTLFEKLAAEGERSAKAIGRQIEAQPVISLLVAFGVGLCVSRLLWR